MFLYLLFLFQSFLGVRNCNLLKGTWGKQVENPAAYLLEQQQVAQNTALKQ